MDYTKIYNDLIFSRKLLNRRKKDDKYYENHHIIPKCVGGDDCKYNMVLLTAREHYFAHYLLTKIYNDNSLIFAFNMMNVSSPSQERKYLNSRFYNSNKIKLSKIVSDRNSLLYSGERNPMFGKNHSEETIQKLINWHSNMSVEEKEIRKMSISDGTKIAMSNLDPLKKYNMLINQQYGSHGFHFIMVKDKNGNEYLFSDLKKGLSGFIKDNNYNSKFYKWDYNKPYEKYNNYTNKVSKTILQKDINTIGLIKYKMERIKI